MGRVILYIFCFVCFLFTGEKQPEPTVSNDLPQSCVAESVVLPVNATATQHSTISRTVFIPFLIADCRYSITGNNISFPGKYVRNQFSTSNGLQGIPVYILVSGNTERDTISHPYDSIYYLRKLLI